jgi:retron-type reverse transcriptase
MVRAGYVEFNTIKKTQKDTTLTRHGLRLGSIITPILSNLYLHELDCFIETERIKLDGLYKMSNKNNKEYTNRIQTSTKQRGEIFKENVKLERAHKMRRLVNHDETTTKIYYVRYAED